MLCKFCGKEIPADARFCANCGASVNAQKETAEEQPPKESFCRHDFAPPPCPPYMPAKKKSNAFCITGFVLSLGSLFLSFFGLVAIAGLTLSIIGVIQASRRGEGLKGLGIAGIAVSACSLVFTYIAIFSLALLLTSLMWY